MPALFYHLTLSTDEDVIRTLLPRALAQGWRVFLRGVDPVALARLDERLWREPAESFLPHGMEGGPHDARQPVLLGTGPAGNAAQGVILTGGAEASVEEALALQRLWVLFDGGDEAALAAARGLWATLAAGGVALEYWSEAQGKWEKTAAKPAP